MPAIEKIQEQIQPTRELAPLKNFNLNWDQQSKELLEDGIEENLEQIKTFLDNTFDREWDLDKNKVNIYFFSDEEEYYAYLDKHFPDSPRDTATFDKETNSVLLIVPTTKHFKHYKELLSLDNPSEKKCCRILRLWHYQLLLMKCHVYILFTEELAMMHPKVGGIRKWCASLIRKH